MGPCKHTCLHLRPFNYTQHTHTVICQIYTKTLLGISVSRKLLSFGTGVTIRSRCGYVIYADTSKKYVDSISRQTWQQDSNLTCDVEKNKNKQKQKTKEKKRKISQFCFTFKRELIISAFVSLFIIFISMMMMIKINIY